MHAAAWKGYADIVQLLLAKGKVCAQFLWFSLTVKNRLRPIIPFEIGERVGGTLF